MANQNRNAQIIIVKNSELGYIELPLRNAIDELKLFVLGLSESPIDPITDLTVTVTKTQMIANYTFDYEPQQLIFTIC